MREPMSDEELRQIRLRAAHATEGPWVCETSENGDGDIHFTVRSTASFPEHPWSPRYVAWLMGTIRSANVEHPHGQPCPTCGYYVHRHRAVQVAVDQREDQWIRDDAEFLAHAREDVPALLAEVKRLRNENAAMREIVEAMASDHEHKWRPDRCKICGVEFSTWAADMQLQARALVAQWKEPSADAD